MESHIRIPDTFLELEIQAETVQQRNHCEAPQFVSGFHLAPPEKQNKFFPVDIIHMAKLPSLLIH